MKISSIQLFRPFHRFLPILLFFSVIGLFNESMAQSGEELFNQRCAQCHQFHVDGTGPKLYEARKRWEKDGEGEFIIEWVQNNSKLTDKILEKGMQNQLSSL